MATVIIGAGIVGVSTAYYLSEHQHASSADNTPAAIHLVETTDRLFASASGYAGGFLARDWVAPAAAEVAALSFDQHRALADKYDGRKHWGYATSTSLSYGLPDGEDSAAAGKRTRGEDWLRQGTSRSTSAPTTAPTTATDSSAKTGLPTWLHRQPGDSVEVLADDGSSAQVDPLLFCEFLLGKCRERGVQVHQPARAVAVGADEHGALATVTLETGALGGPQTELVLPCTSLVITAGAWTPQVFEQLFPAAGRGRATPLLPVTNYAGHSLVVRAPASVWAAPETESGTFGSSPAPTCHALFAARGPLAYCPEIFSRANGTLYMAGLNSSTMPLPRLATDAVPDPAQLDDLLASCRKVMGVDTEGYGFEVVRTGLCHRPATPWGFPLVLRIPDEVLRLRGSGRAAKATGAGGGVYVASGHGPWGISMGPGTGMVLAEMVQGRALSADVSGLGFQT